MADILDLNTEEEFEGVEGDREVRMKDVDEEEETVSKLKEKARKRKGRGFGGGRRGDSDAEGDYDRLVNLHNASVAFNAIVCPLRWHAFTLMVPVNSGGRCF